METPFIAQDRLNELRDNLMAEADNVPHLTERLLVDIVNGLAVNDDQLCYKASQGILSRAIGFVDGSNRRREMMIQRGQQEMTRGLLAWVEDLTYSQTVTNRALTRALALLESTRADLLSVAEHSMKNRELLREHAARLESLERKLEVDVIPRLEHLEDFKRISMKRSAWSAGRLYKGYSLPVQAAFFIDDVARGEYGERIWKDDELRAYFQDEAVVALRDLEFGGGSSIEIRRLVEQTLCSDDGRARLASALLDLGEGIPLHHMLASAASGQASIGGVQRMTVAGDLYPAYTRERFVGELTRETELAWRN